jgi:tetratricopeptide (TPR) repeat protein
MKVWLDSHKLRGREDHMSDSTRPRLEDQIDRYARRELSAAEAQELAQRSLDDPELFEDLTFSALANAALSASSVRDQLQQRGSGAKVFRFPRKAILWVATAAAAVLLISVYFPRLPFFRRNRPSLVQNQSPETAPSSLLTPALPFAAKPGQPVLLASDLQPDRRERPQVFRGSEPESRLPQPAGSIVSIEDGLAVIDLGSLDGLAKGSELRIFRDERSTQPIGRLMVTTVFRERARGRILTRQEIHTNNRVQVASAAYLGALLERVDALAGQGDSNAARMIAEKVVGWAESASVPPGEKRKALERLAGLEYQAGSLEAAEKHYQSAIDSLDATPPASALEQSVVFNNLAVLHMLHGDYGGAESPLSQAVSRAPAADSAHVRSLNNLGVLAELRGDRRKAQELYAEALGALKGISNASGQERRAVETNLARLRSLR